MHHINNFKATVLRNHFIRLIENLVINELNKNRSNLQYMYDQLFNCLTLVYIYSVELWSAINLISFGLGNTI